MDPRRNVLDHKKSNVCVAYSDDELLLVLDVRLRKWLQFYGILIIYGIPVRDVLLDVYKFKVFEIEWL